MARRVKRSAQPDVDRRLPGRPRVAATDASILRATAELIGEVGVPGTTISEVARRAGVARASVYLRWPTRAALIGAATKSTIGGRAFPLTGDLLHDMEVGAHFLRDAAAAPPFNAMFPEIVAEVLAEHPAVSWDDISPNRLRLAEAYASDAAALGLRSDIDPDLPYHLLVGGILSYLLVNGQAPTHEWTQRLYAVAVAGLRSEPQG